MTQREKHRTVGALLGGGLILTGVGIGAIWGTPTAILGAGLALLVMGLIVLGGTSE
jgi:hypothetical protein